MQNAGYFTLYLRRHALNMIFPLSLPLIIMMLDYLLGQHRVDNIEPYYITTIRRLDMAIKIN